MTTHRAPLDRHTVDMITALTEHAGKDRNRPVLTAVAFGPEGTYATDSYTLGIGPALEWDNPPGTEHGEWVLVDARELKKALKTVGPNKTAFFDAGITVDTEAGTVTVRENEWCGKGDDRERTDLPAGASVTMRTVEGTFPNVTALIPDTSYEDAGPVPALNAKLLGRFAKLAAAVEALEDARTGTPEAVHLVASPLNDGKTLAPVRVDAPTGTVIGLVMPVRTERSVRDVQAAALRNAEQEASGEVAA